MLPAAARLRRRAEFSLVARTGARAGGPLLAVRLVVPDPSTGPAGPARAGFVVSRAVGPATVRNLVRRRLRHAVRPRLADLPDGAMLVVRASPAAAHAPYGRLDAELGTAIDRARARAAR